MARVERQVGVALGHLPVDGQRGSRQSALVLDRKFVTHRVVPDGHGGHDHGAELAPGHRPVQPRVERRGEGRGPGGVRFRGRALHGGGPARGPTDLLLPYAAEAEAQASC